jgi:hypothetical protein
MAAKNTVAVVAFVVKEEGTLEPYNKGPVISHTLPRVLISVSGFDQTHCPFF